MYALLEQRRFRNIHTYCCCRVQDDADAFFASLSETQTFQKPNHLLRSGTFREGFLSYHFLP